MKKFRYYLKAEAEIVETKKGAKKVEKEKKLVKKRPQVKVEKKMGVYQEETDIGSSDRYAVGTKVFGNWVDGTGVCFYPAEVVERKKWRTGESSFL